MECLLFVMGLNKFFGWLLTPPSGYYEAVESLKDTQMYKDWLFRTREQEINDYYKNKIVERVIK